MGLLDKLKPQPRWKHADPAVRLEAVRELDDAAELAVLAESDQDARVRRAAICRITDPAVLGRVAAADADPETRDLPEHDRGLIFVSYQTSIDSQFVFLQKNWANDSVNPNNGGGQDAIIGQRSEPERVRTVVITADNGVVDVVTLDREWVIPTGGGFFFSPSISTIANVLGRLQT